MKQSSVLQSIQTKFSFQGRGVRVLAVSTSGIRHFHRPSGLEPKEEHRAAAEHLAKTLDWNQPLIQAATKEGFVSSCFPPWPNFTPTDPAGPIFKLSRL